MKEWDGSESAFVHLTQHFSNKNDFAIALRNKKHPLKSRATMAFLKQR